MHTEVRGVNTHNKGAHLMLVAIARNLSHKHVLTVSPNGSDYVSRAKLGLHQTAVLNQAPRATATLGNVVPQKLCKMYGLSRMRDIGAVLDASGFAYSDSFGAGRAEREGALLGAWERRSVARIFLPQAYGPFNDRATAQATARLLAGADLIYARDPASADYLSDLSPILNISISPDFTIAEEPIFPNDQPDDHYACFIPNSKLVTHGKVREADYIKSAGRIIDEFIKAGLSPIVAAHESTDLDLAKRISAATGAQDRWYNDPLVMKGLLGGASINVGSRFHALVGSLSLGRPSICIGWTHKYDGLLDDFGAVDWVASDMREAANLVSLVLSDVQGRQKVATHAAELKVRVKKMWNEVSQTVGGER